jgi:hypothetical protein
MSSPSTIELKNIDSGDLDDVLKKVEKSFGFQFGKTELKDVQTFGELCDIITSKVQGDSTNDCTSQQAFYKLRGAVAATLYVDESSFTLSTTLQELFPRQQRLKQIKAVERKLGCQLNLLRPKHWITMTFLLVFLASLVALYFSWQVGLIGLASSIATYKIAYNFGKELDLKTVRELAEKIAREHYKKVRRNPATVNKAEVAKKVKELFMIELDLEEGVLTRQATFG